MRFMILVKADSDSEAGVFPGKELVTEMGKLNDEMVKAGVLLAADGLQASSKGVRINFSGGRRTVTDGPFAEAKELVAGYSVIQVGSKEEAVEWASRMPFTDADIEIRQLFDESDYPPELFAPEDAAHGQAPR
jgi:hypothetical protein